MRTVPFAALLVVVLVVVNAARGAAEPEREDPEVAACKQQCARQWQFGAAERRSCVARCDEYGRQKREEEEDSPEKERDRCLHECRAGRTRKPGCGRRCLEEYERATRGRRGGGGTREEVDTVTVAGPRFRGKWHDAAA